MPLRHTQHDLADGVIAPHQAVCICDLREVEQVADHLVLIAAGRLVFQGTVADLASRRPPTISLRPEHPYDGAAVAELAATLHWPAAVQEDGEVTVSLPPSLSVEDSLARAAELNRRAHAADIVLAGLGLRRPTLEESFLQLTGVDSGDVA